jgi:hypothetical protein
LKEARQEGQLRLERQLVDQARELSDLREALRAAGVVPPPATRTMMANGSKAHNDNL